MPDDFTSAQAKTPPPQPNPALKPLEVLVGEWSVELVFPADPATIGRTHTSFKYHLNFSGREKPLMWLNPCCSNKDGYHVERKRLG